MVCFEENIAVFVAFAVINLCGASQKQPNIIFVLADDLGEKGENVDHWLFKFVRVRFQPFPF